MNKVAIVLAVVITILITTRCYAPTFLRVQIPSIECSSKKNMISWNNYLWVRLKES